DEGRDFVGHGGEKAPPPCWRERAGAQRRLQGDLDVDLDIGGVDAGGVVDGVGIVAAALAGIFDAPALREAEIGALAYDAGTHLARFYADGVIGVVADFGVGLVAGAHESADAAEPEE